MRRTANAADISINFEVLQRRVSKGVSVSTQEVAAAMRLAFEKLHLVVEPGVPLRWLLFWLERYR
jgi:threonine dehydratase